MGRFLTQDPWAGTVVSPATLNAYGYVKSNPVRFVDALGLCDYDPYDPYIDYECWISAIDPSRATSGKVGRWDSQAVRGISRLKQALLGSAVRHNRIPDMDDNGFAALVASVIVSERRIGNKPSLDDPRNWISQFAEDAVAAFGCTVSGYEIKDAVDRRDWSDFFQYLFNMEIPENDGIRQWASVGIGNIKLNTAADLWLGQWDLGPLQVTNVFGQDVDIENPFAAHATCTAMFGGSCETYQPTEVESYRLLTRQLLNRKINVEYVAGNLEVGALRAMSLGLRPSAFNSASWHLRGLQTDKEIIDSRWNPGGAIYIVDDIPTALDVLGLTSTWNLSTEPQYAYHMARQSK